MVHLIGRITRQGIVRETANDKKVLNFTIALNDYYKDKEGKKVEQVTYINCSYWRNPESVVKFITSGVLLEVTGRLSAHGYMNSENEAVAQIDCNVNNIVFLSKGNEGSQPKNGKRIGKGKGNRQNEVPEETNVDDKDLPF